MSYLDQLNDVQRLAVTTTDGPVLIVAGPGSGKTRVLTYRIAHLIEKRVAPHQILALTFTNKAAKEMKERIQITAGNAAFQVWAGTFHSIFARILRVEAEHIGYPSNFTIYDSDDSKNLIKTLIKEMNLDNKVYNANNIKNRISSAKSNLITPKLYTNDEQLMTEDKHSKMPYLHKIYARYTARCKKAGAMDFDDLLFRLYELFQSKPEILDKYRKRFSHILVDEFQDTNRLQYAIVRKLVNYPKSSHNVCAVGDDAQSIYAFRGATIQNILDYEEDYKKHNIKVFKLEQNYRSTQHIVEAANHIIMNNKKQIQKKIWSHKGTGRKIALIKARTDGEEGKRIADTIVEQKNRYHFSNKEIAILYRTNAQSRTFEEYLRRYNIPYRIFGGQSFYQRKEIKDMVAYLRLVVNPKDEEALRRVLNYPKRGIGKTTQDKLGSIATQLDKSMWECLPNIQASTRAKNSITDFVKTISTASQMSQTQNAHEVALYVSKKSGLYDLLKSDNSIEGMSRLENFNSLMDGIQTFAEEDSRDENVIDTDTIPDRSLASYLQNIALLTDADEKKLGDDFVTLMSVHAAKGLEFKSVFVVGLEENLFPSFMALDSFEGLDEERRLFYVAITRAEEALTLSYAESRYQFGKMRFNNPSRFLEEIPEEHLDQGFFSAREKARAHPSGPHKSGVSGYFKPQSSARRPEFTPPEGFTPNDPSEIQAGMKVLHIRFGQGKVINIEGAGAGRMATIHFPDLSTPEKRIMLRFAKLQILK